jgi:uncharacterized protein YbgA (DUF1722 family)/uncharacterized protein YbbK (DUF523 family)
VAHAAVTGERAPWRDAGPIRVGISACLLGEPVRWDGGHKRDSYLTDVLGPCFEWVPVCPEVETGMGTPRPPVRLVRVRGQLRMRGAEDGSDWTRTMEGYAARRLRGLAAQGLCGYVLKKGSPSCGMERVAVHRGKGSPEKSGRGLFAAALLRRFGSLPVEEEGRLRDARLREAWIERVFAYHRLRSLRGGRLSRGRLVAFHAAHELQLLAHSETHHRRLGRLVAETKETVGSALRTRYEAGFMAALARPATSRRHASVLLHALGQLRGRAAPGALRELHQLVEAYRGGLVPLVVPLTLLRHYVKLLGVDSLADQVYLDPHPKELMLRNHV